MSNESSEDYSMIVVDYVMGTRCTDVERTIGKGTFGKVRLAVHGPTNYQVAVKILYKNRIIEYSDSIRVARELQILKMLRHPNIIQLYEIVKTHQQIFLFMEYAEGGELFELIVKKQKLDEFYASRYLQQIINAVEYMHKMGVAHRDLKPYNLLFDSKKNIKIADFGLSCQYTEGLYLTTACGSPCYAAPEMVSGKAYHGLKTDIWSCGIILYAMICGYLPFEDPDTAELYRKIKYCEYEVPHHVSITARDLLNRMLNTDPEKRITIEGIRKHNFCMKKEPIINGLTKYYPNRAIEPELQPRLHLINISEYRLGDDLQHNRHNSTTTAYNLLLKQWLKEKNMTLTEYYIKKEAYPAIVIKEQVRVRKRKVPSTERIQRKPMLEPWPSRYLPRFDSRYTKVTSRYMSRDVSRPQPYKSPPPRPNDRHSLTKLTKKYSKVDQVLVAQLRKRMKSELPAPKYPKDSQTREIQKLVNIIDQRLEKLQSSKGKNLAQLSLLTRDRPVTIIPTSLQQTPVSNIGNAIVTYVPAFQDFINNEEYKMLRRIHLKNLNKIQQHSPSQKRCKG